MSVTASPIVLTITRRHWDSSCWQDLGILTPDNMIAHVWPGGYPVVYVDPEDESEGLCVDTVREMIAAGEWSSSVVSSYTHYEGAAIECTCGAHIESAYGDPDSPDDADAESDAS